MSKSTRNANKPWTKSDVTKLKNLVKENTPTRVIGIKLGRSPSAIYSKASSEGVSLKPTNQSPYSHRYSTGQEPNSRKKPPKPR